MAAATGSANANALKDEGNRMFRMENYEGALSAFTQAIKYDNKNHVLYSNRSAAYSKLRRYKEALDDAGKCISLNPEWKKGYIRRGAALQGFGRYDDAMKDYKFAFAGNATDPELQRLIRELETEQNLGKQKRTDDQRKQDRDFEMAKGVRHLQKIDPNWRSPEAIAQAKADAPTQHLEGWLQKRGKIRSHKRFFRLAGTELSWKDEEKDEEWKQTVDLAGCILHDVVAQEFQLYCPSLPTSAGSSPQIELKADSVEERQKWYDALSIAIEQANRKKSKPTCVN